jgi:hypothetical protein
MHQCGWRGYFLFVLLAVPVRPACATGVPIDGFLPMVGISLTHEYIDDFTFAPVPSTTMSEPQLGAGGSAHYDVALLDTGAAVSILNATSRPLFGIDDEFPGDAGDDGFAGGNTITIGGATCFVEGDILDPLGLYASGLQNPPRTSTSGPLAITPSGMVGQTNTSMVAVPPESDLPNVLGLSFASQYTTRIRSDQPQIFSMNGHTVRTPAIEFHPRGSGGMGITRKAPLSLNGDSPVTPQHIPTLNPDLILDTPWEDPFAPTVVFGGLFLTVDVEDDAAGEGGELDNYQFFFDTGASVTVLSEFNAFQLGFDVTVDEPEFTLAIVGSGGTKLDVPGFFVDKFTLPALGGSIVATNVPVIVLDIADPSDPNNIIDGFVGTNLLSGRNLTIDPNPATSGGPSAGLYISDPVTVQANWTSTSSSAWDQAGSWSNAAVPANLTIANVRRTSAAIVPAVISSNTTVWEVNISGLSDSQRMTLSITNGAKLTTFTGLNIEQFGEFSLANGSLDVQYVDIRNGGRLTGNGSIATGSGPIPGQVENVAGVVAPNGPTSVTAPGTINIEGRFSNGFAGTVELHVAGASAGQFDRLVVDGPITLDGTLRVVSSASLAPRTELAVITSTDGIVGEFEMLDLPALSGDRAFVVDYSELAVTLKVTLRGDFDGDFDFDNDDLAKWRAGYGSKYSGQDFLHWQRRLGTTIPNVSAVPEPAGAALALTGLALGTHRKRRRLTSF